MISLHSITVNPFQENTYILWDESGDCAIIDPGCSNAYEEALITDFISSNGLKPVLLLNTHGHIDHILGNQFVAEHYGLELQIHEEDVPALLAGAQIARQYGIPYTPSPEPSSFLAEGDTIQFGQSKMDIVFTPGHSRGSVCFISHEDKMVIGGDVLFYNSIGRTDLPGGNHELLLGSIRNKLYILPDDFVIYPGHGPSTTIGFEKRTNPFT